MEQFERVSHDIRIMGGKACIAGTRVTVGMIVMQISEGTAIEEILAEYPYLDSEDIAEALRYAACAIGTKEELVWLGGLL